MAWKIWRQTRERERADELGVSIDELRVDPIRLMGWYFRWLAQILPETTLYQFLRMLEVPAIIVALVAFWIDYADRPIDRATRNAQLLAQVAQLATIEHANASGGIKAIIEFLADEKVSMRGIALERTKLSGVDLERAHLRSANLSRSSLTDANLSRADLTLADLTYAELWIANLTRADLMYADLTDADLSGANLTLANLTNTNLTDANLAFADLTGANLTDADLTGANLSVADLTDAGLAFADFAFAELTGTFDLMDTIVTQEQLDAACIRKGGTPPTLAEGLRPPQKVCVPQIW